MCKPNYAENVKRKMSGRPLRSNCSSLLVPDMCANKRRDSTQKELDSQPCMYINILTATRHGRPATNQTILLARAGHAESSPESSAARELSRQRVLRSGRFAAGQVRDAQPISQAAKTFGFSRPSFYQAQAAFQEAGLAGLLPQKRGPRSGHKLTPELMQFVTQLRLSEPTISSPQIAERIAERFQVSVHPRSIDRQLLRQKKLR